MAELRAIDGLTMLAAEPASPSKPPLLFVHGYLATARVFDHFIEYFCQRGHACVAVNLRGRDGSLNGTDLGRASMDDFVDDAARAARTLGRPVVVGHSMGGLIAQKLAERGDARAAVLMSPAPPRGITVFTFELLRRQWRYLLDILRSRPVVARAEDFIPLVLNHIPREKQRDVFAQFVPDSGRAARDMLTGSVRVDERQVTCPVFTVASEDDHFIPLATVQRIAKKYGSPLYVAAGHGHLVMQEPGWEKIAGVLGLWIDDQSTSLLSPGGAT
jgi:pimeloyl-ACP methyl ester carboxylesterase